MRNLTVRQVKWEKCSKKRRKTPNILLTFCFIIICNIIIMIFIP